MLAKVARITNEEKTMLAKVVRRTNEKKTMLATVARRTNEEKTMLAKVTLTERVLEVDLYLCFMDYTKAFDKVKHDKIIKMLEDIKLDGKDLRIVKHLYRQQKAAIRVGNKNGKIATNKTRGATGICSIFRSFFSQYSENHKNDHYRTSYKSRGIQY